jgi:hypothetical protein
VLMRSSPRGGCVLWAKAFATGRASRPTVDSSVGPREARGVPDAARGRRAAQEEVHGGPFRGCREAVVTPPSQ